MANDAAQATTMKDAEVWAGPHKCVPCDESFLNVQSDDWPDESGKPYTSMEVSCVCTDGDPITAEQDGKIFHGLGLMFGDRLVAVFGTAVVVQTFTPEGAAKARSLMKSAVIG